MDNTEKSEERFIPLYLDMFEDVPPEYLRDVIAEVTEKFPNGIPATVEGLEQARDMCLSFTTCVHLAPKQEQERFHYNSIHCRGKDLDKIMLRLLLTIQDNKQ